MKHGVLTDSQILDDCKTMLSQVKCADTESTHKKYIVVGWIENAISAAPDAVIPVTKHQCYTCYANYDGKCMPAQESCGRYAYDEGSGAPDWCPQITKE